MDQTGALGISQRSIVPYGGGDVWNATAERTFQPYVQPGDVGGVPGVLRQGFYPAEDYYAPGDSQNVRALTPQVIPYGTNRRATDLSGLSALLGGNDLPIIGLAVLVGLLLFSEGLRPKGAVSVKAST